MCSVIYGCLLCLLVCFALSCLFVDLCFFVCSCVSDFFVCLSLC